MTTIQPERSTFPRPPAVGEESKMIHETADNYPESSWSMDHHPAKLAEQQVCSSNPSCLNATESAGPQDSSEASSRPTNWVRSLRCLLEDKEGVGLFKEFLKQECQDTTCLMFWLACKGFKDIYLGDSSLKLVKCIFEKQIRRIKAISEDTREQIRQRLASNDVDVTIFDAAKQEVENYMTRTTYPNFLQSDLYIQYLDSCMSKPPAEKENPVVPPEVRNLLPTVHEDSELRLVKPLTKNNLLVRHIFSPTTKPKLEGPAGYLKNPYNAYSSYHSKYGSYLPASAQDSEIQSLSSDALSEDSVSHSNLTMSLDDLTIDKAPIHSRNMQMKRHKFPMRDSTQQIDAQSVIINPDDGFAEVMPRKNDRLRHTQSAQLPLKDFHRILTKKLNKVAIGDKIMEKLSGLESEEKGEALKEKVENEEILDQHISRVFGQQSGQHSPASGQHSSGCLSPPGAKAAAGSSSCQRSSFEAQQKDQISVPNKRKDQDTVSTDSAMFDYASDDNMSANYKNHHSSGVNSDLVDYSKLFREQSKRYMSRKPTSLNSSISCVDSGVGLACESEPAYSELTCWLKENVKKNSSHSSAVRSSHKGFVYKSQSACLEAGCSQWSAISTHSFQDSRAPCYDATTNFAEARKFEDDFKKLKLKNASGRTSDLSKMKFSKGYEASEDNFCHKKMSRKSFPSTGYESSSSGSLCNDVTVIAYSFGVRSVPFLSKFPGKNVTLRQFKSLLSKRGNFRYFFKTASNELGTGVVFEEVTDDYKVLPLWEGKVFCVIDSMDNSPGM